MGGGRILVVGDLITDIIVRSQGPIARGSDTRSTIRFMPGGSGANQAAWLGRLGARVAFIGRVGAPDRDEHATALRGFGVEPVLAADDDLPSGRLVTLVAPDGERSFLTDRGANARLARGDLPDALLDGTALLHVSGYALFEPGPRAAVLDYIAGARRRGIAVTVDPGSSGFLREFGGAAFLDWTRGLAACFPNADEAEVLSGSAEPEAQLASLCAVYEMAVIKRGGEGVAAGTARGERWSLPARPVAVLDTTGAGDAFLAGFLDARNRDRLVPECLASGIELGSFAATILGGRPPVAP